MFSLDKVSVSFGELEVLKDFQLNSAGNEFICLFGASGIGKTSILNMLAGILKPQKGHVHTKHSRNAYVFQEPRLLPWCTVRDNVMLGLYSSKMEKNQRIKRTDMLINKMGLGDFADYYPGQLSGGMKQRVSLGRAFAVQPDLLLMDEPFSSLDQNLKLEMRELLRELIEWQPCTTVFVTHDVKEGIQLADRIVVLSGRPCQIINEFNPEKHLRMGEDYQRRLAETIFKETFKNGKAPSSICSLI